MNLDHKYSLNYALLLSAFFMTFWSFGQGKLELLPGSEKVYFDPKTQTHRLVGTVSFTYQGNSMFCDSAHYKEKQKIVWAYGNVHITKGDVNLYCDSLYYSGSRRFAKLWGHVRVRDNEYKLSSDSVDYDVKTGRATYRNYGRIENSLNNEVITSKVGYFYPATGSYFFSGKVKYVKDDLIMTTDTLQFAYEKQTTFFYGPTHIKNDSIEIKCERGLYKVDKRLGQLRKNVEIIQKDRRILCDTADYTELHQEFLGRGHVKIYENNRHIQLYGDRFYSKNNLEKSLLNGRAMALETSQKDTMFLLADSIYLNKDSLQDERIIIANHNVKMYTHDAQAISDSAFYSTRKGYLDLFKSPILWTKSSELKADTIHTIILDSTIKQAQLWGNASIIMELDSGLYYNQLAGKTIIADFDKNKLSQAKVKGNAWTIFYPIEEEKNDSTLIRKRIGLNRLYASELFVYMEEGEVKGITYFSKPDGIFFPMDKIDKNEMYIDGFEWKISQRPKRPQTKIIL